MYSKLNFVIWENIYKYFQKKHIRYIDRNNTSIRNKNYTNLN